MYGDGTSACARASECAHCTTGRWQALARSFPSESISDSCQHQSLFRYPHRAQLPHVTSVYPAPSNGRVTAARRASPATRDLPGRRGWTDRKARPGERVTPARPARASAGSGPSRVRRSAAARTCPPPSLTVRPPAPLWPH